MSAHRLSDINLLPQDTFETSNVGRALRWIQITGRVILVFTMLVVIIAFGSRFWFDKELNDLTDKINGKQAVIKSFSEVETKMRDILFREGKTNDFLNDDLDIGDVFSSLVNASPADVSFSSIGVSKKGISMIGKAKSETGFAGFLSNLAKEPRVGSISLGSTKFSQKEGVIEFAVSATINGKEATR